MYTLYAIPGSHACRSATLMLEHKDLPYRRVDVPTLLHPLVSRLLGFDSGNERRAAGPQRTIALRVGDHLGTVPALSADGERVSTNRQIARFLDRRRPERPLFPPDPERRRAVEKVEDWANAELQMTARRIALGWAVRDPAAASRAMANGRLGCLLYRRAITRRYIVPLIGRYSFAVDRSADRELLEELPEILDRIDGWMRAGILGAARPNVADLMVAPSLALILYRPDVAHLFEGRPALDLVDRILPEPRV